MPFIIAAVLSLVGAWIGLFYSGFLAGLLHPGRTALHVLQVAFSFSLSRPLWMMAFPTALGGTILLPVAYYLTRRFWPVTPMRYAAMGAGLALALAVCFYGPLLSYYQPSGWQVAMILTPGAILAGVACGLLFGWSMQGHYQRYRGSMTEAA